jgi:predicted nucleic acid-binding protein
VWDPWSSLAAHNAELRESDTYMLRRITPEDRGKHLTSYDAAYLEWAQRQQLPLATLDTELRGAASAEGVRRLGK